MRCEVDDACSFDVDPTAAALAKHHPRPQDAICLVLAPTCHCTLAVAYHLSSKGGDVLCLPYRTALATSWLDPRATKTAPRVLHWHPVIAPLSAYDEEDVEYGRCHHGTWSYGPALVAHTAAAHREGRIRRPGELVNARHPNGTVTKMGRAAAEADGLPVVGTVQRNPKLDGPYVLGNYVTLADTPDHPSGIDPA